MKHGQNEAGRVDVGREGGLDGVGWRDGEKRHTTVIELSLIHISEPTRPKR